MASGPDTGVINKKSLNVEDRLYSYILEHTREAEVLKELRAETAQVYPRAKGMQISPDQGAFIGWLVGTLGVRRAIEVGVFTGYSSIVTARALAPGGKLVACDPDDRALTLARKYWAKASVADLIEEHVRPASETLDALIQAGQQGQYDFAFVDADKAGYLGYYEQLLQACLMRPGGVIAFDNVLWHGAVADAEDTGNQTRALRAVNDRLMADERVRFSIVPIGDGMALCTKL